VNEHYIQFVPPATFGVIYDSALATIQLVRANGERTQLRKTADKIYTLRGFLGLRRREARDLELRCAVEDEIIRRVLTSFGSSQSLHAAVRRFCPNSENAEAITQLWAPEVFDTQDDGMSSRVFSETNLQRIENESTILSRALLPVNSPSFRQRTLNLPISVSFQLRLIWKEQMPLLLVILHQFRKIHSYQSVQRLSKKRSLIRQLRCKSSKNTPFLWQPL
jgi:hypothetical protein